MGQASRQRLHALFRVPAFVSDAAKKLIFRFSGMLEEIAGIVQKKQEDLGPVLVLDALEHVRIRGFEFRV
jgi:hypothetical protein